jgi:hypothetical protein
MKSPKVKTQKNLSALIAIALAAVTLFSAGAVNSTSSNTVKTKFVEADVLAQIEQMIIEDEAQFEDEVVFEEAQTEVKVFDENNELLGEGTTAGNKNLRALVNKAEFVSELGSTKYYKIIK